MAIPLSLREANAFITEHHRHNKPARGCKFVFGCKMDDRLVGVAIGSRPIARALDDGLTLEITRTCTTGERNVNSFLYGRALRIAAAMGYRKVVTYTQEGESGSSLRAVGFILDAKLPARGSWSESSVRSQHLRDPVGNGGVERARWVREIQTERGGK